MTSRVLYTNGSREKTLLSAGSYTDGGNKLNGLLRTNSGLRFKLQAPIDKQQHKTNFNAVSYPKTTAEQGNGEANGIFIQRMIQNKQTGYVDAKKLFSANIGSQAQLNPKLALPTCDQPSFRPEVVASIMVKYPSGNNSSDSAPYAACDANKAKVLNRGAAAPAAGDHEESAAEFEEDQTEYCRKAEQILQFARMDADAVKNLCLPNEAERLCQMRVEALAYMGDFLCRERTDPEDINAYLPPESRRFRADVIEITVRAFYEIVVDHSACTTISSRTSPTTVGINGEDGPDGPPSSKYGLSGGAAENSESEQRWHWYRCPMYELFIDFLSHPFFSLGTGSDVALRPHITPSLFAKFLQQFYSERDDELKLAKDTLHRMYAVMPTQRRKFREKMNSMLLNVTYHDPHCAGVKDVLEVYSAIICGFVQPLKREHTMFLVRVLLPMLKASSFVTFHEQWLADVLLFFKSDDALTGPVLDALLLYWPRQDGQKQVIFTCLLEEVLNHTPPKVILHFVGRLFALFARCIRSQHLAIIERVLLLFGNDYLLQVFIGEKAIVMPIFFREIYASIMEHKQAYAQRRGSAAVPPAPAIRAPGNGKITDATPPAAKPDCSELNDWNLLVKKFDLFLEKFETLAPELYMQLARAQPYPVFTRRPQSSVLYESPSAAASIAAETDAAQRRRELLWQRIELRRQFPFHGTFHNFFTSHAGIDSTLHIYSFRGYYHNLEPPTTSATSSTAPSAGEDGRCNRSSSRSDAKSSVSNKNKNSPQKKRKKLISAAFDAGKQPKSAYADSDGRRDNNGNGKFCSTLDAGQYNAQSYTLRSQNKSANTDIYADKAALFPNNHTSANNCDSENTQAADNQGTRASRPSDHNPLKWYNEW